MKELIAKPEYTRITFTRYWDGEETEFTTFYKLELPLNDHAKAIYKITGKDVVGEMYDILEYERGRGVTKYAYPKQGVEIEYYATKEDWLKAGAPYEWLNRANSYAVITSV